MKDKVNAYSKKEHKIEKQSTAKTGRGQKAVVKDSNKTRRKQKLPVKGQIK